MGSQWGGGLRWGWGSASGAALLPDPLLSSLVVTGATSGIGRAYAREVSRGAEPCGWWGFRLWSETPVGLRVAYFIGFPRTLSFRESSLCSPASLCFPLLPDTCLHGASTGSWHFPITAQVHSFKAYLWMYLFLLGIFVFKFMRDIGL